MVDTTATTGSAPVAPESGADAPPPPPARPKGATFRKWRARFLVLLLIAAAVFAFMKVSQSQAANAAEIDLGTVQLTSQVVPVETPQPGQVISVDVAAEERVVAGKQLGTVEITTTNSQGKPVKQTLAIRAPRDGIVVDDPVTVGSTLQPGQPFVQLYDPKKVYFTGQVPLKDLPELAPGMVATLRAEGLKKPISAVLQRAVPRVGTSQTDVPAGAMRVVLVPRNLAQVTGLVPGLRFTGTIDTTTVPAGKKRLVYVALPS
jgi:multidrug resistance efflux pump